MILTLDLHVHSDASHDGRLRPAEIIAAARAAGLDGVAICDHDTFPDLTGVEIPEDFLLIPGVEISTDLGHILGLLFDAPPEIPKNRSAADAIDAIHAAGGLAVLAHPFQHSRDEERLTPLIGKLDGVEVFNARAARKNRDANDRALDFCVQNDLAPFAGSDAHVAREIGGGRMRVEVKDRSLPAVREAMLGGGAAASGKNGRHIDVARSQWTKLRKQGADPGKYGKWALFAIKCAAEDLFRRGK